MGEGGGRTGIHGTMLQNANMQTRRTGRANNASGVRIAAHTVHTGGARQAHVPLPSPPPIPLARENGRPRLETNPPTHRLARRAAARGREHHD